MIVAGVAALARHAPLAGVMRMCAGGCRWLPVLSGNVPSPGAIDESLGRLTSLSPHTILVVLLLGPLRPQLKA